MQENWPQSLKWVRLDEGGNNDDPDDSGGRTSRGITQREYNAWCELHHFPQGDVWEADDSHIDQIYQGEYWQPQCDDLPCGSDYIFFDMNVNSGPHEATILLQRALGVNDDGRIGAVTKLALQKADQTKLVQAYAAEKRMFYTNLAIRNSHDKKFLKGWLDRTIRVTARATSLIKPKEVPSGYSPVVA